MTSKKDLYGPQTMKCNDPQFSIFQISEPSDEKREEKDERKESTVNRSMLRLRHNRSRMFAYVGTITLAFFFDHTNNLALTLKITRIYRSTRNVPRLQLCTM